MSGSIVDFRPKVAFAFETISATGIAQGLTVATFKPSGSAIASEAFLTLSGGDIRYRYDGIAPTASVGHLLSDGGYLRLKGQHQLENFKFILTGTRTGVLSISYERE